MKYTAREVIEFVRANDVKFIHLSFCDLFGLQKNLSIQPGELPRAFAEGISFDASAIRGYADVSRSDLLLSPDPATLQVLPWRPAQGSVLRLYCDIKNPDGMPFPLDPRRFLKEAVRRAASAGVDVSVGTECEFYLFLCDPQGHPTLIPHDRAGYLDMTPPDRGENVRREICLCIEEFGLKPEASHHERGPGQHEIDFQPGDPLTAADNFLSFKTVVKAVAERSGLFASFLPKPLPGESGSGLHVNLSLRQNGRCVFDDCSENGEVLSPAAAGFLAGILRRIREISVFSNPLANSYQRFGAFEAPSWVSWSAQNRSQLVRIPAAVGPRRRMELRSPDPSCNPHLCFALLVEAGLEGLREGLSPPGARNENLYAADPARLAGVPRLPESLGEAVALAQDSEFLKSVLGEALLSRYLEEKRREAGEFAAADGQAMTTERYFPLI